MRAIPRYICAGAFLKRIKASLDNGVAFYAAHNLYNKESCLAN